MVEYDIPAMIHVSTSCNACFHTTGAHYLNADTTAFMQCLTSDLFKDFPTLRFIIPHGGGAVPYHWGRFRGLAHELKKPLLREHVLGNVFFDTCVYHQPGIDLLSGDPGREHPLRLRDDRRRARHRPRNGQLLRRHQALHRGQHNPQQARSQQIYEGNARRVFPRLDALLASRQAQLASKFDPPRQATRTTFQVNTDGQHNPSNPDGDR